ncbi:hypothetical protein MKX79_07920 [Viridibacillus sp. FSL R5-0468]
MKEVVCPPVSVLIRFFMTSGCETISSVDTKDKANPIIMGFHNGRT